MRNDKKEFTLDVVSGIDDEIVERHLVKRYKLWQRRGKRVRLGLISAIAAVLCLAILGGAVSMVVFGKQVPVYQGMTVSTRAPSAAVSEQTLPGSMISLLSTSDALPAYGMSQLSEESTADVEAERGPIVFGKTYYALKNEDIYIHIHLSNPDGFEIVSFTLNGVKYTNYMFEPGSDLETLILKYNVGDVDGLQEYTIDAIKYIDGEAIKDVRMKGDKTVKVYVNDDTQALRFETVSEFTTLHLTPVWDEAFTGEKTIQTLALYDEETLLRELSPTDTEITDLPMGKRLVLVATYLDGGVTQTLRYVFDTPKYSEGLQITGGVITGMGTCSDTVLYLNQPIGYEAFKGNEQITAVYFGPGVTSIGGNAFVLCRGLEKAVFVANPERIDGGLFWECFNLTEVKLPEDMIKLPTHIFACCEGLESITLPEGLEYIGVGAFSDCITLESIVFPDSLTHIDESAFWGCSSLDNVFIPDSVTRIGVSAFGGCTNLKNIKLPDHIEEFPSGLFSNSTGLVHVEIPESVTTIGEFCFAGTSSLESICIPDSVEKIYSYAFHQCENLKSIELSGNVRFVTDSDSNLGDEVWFSSCKKLTTVKLHGDTFRFDFSIFRNTGYQPIVIRDVYYDGTKEEFRNCFPNDRYLREYSPTIHCTDGDFKYG